MTSMMQQRPAASFPAQKPLATGSLGVSTVSGGVVESAEAAPAPKRTKKRKLPENKLPEKVAHVIPESSLFNSLVTVEKRLDGIIKRRKADVHDQNGLPTYSKRLLRVYLFNFHHNQGNASKLNATEKPSWTFVLHGRVVDPSEEEEADSTVAATKASSSTGPPFASYVKSLRITLDDTRCSGGGPVLTWDKAKHSGEFSDSFEVKRQGCEEITVKVSLDLDWQPMRYYLPYKLAEILGLQYETRAKVLQALWLYIKSKGLLNMQDAGGPTVNCDAVLESVFNAPSVRMAAVSERLSTVLSPMKPLELEYKIKMDGQSPCHPDCVDIEMEEAAVPRQPLVTSADLAARDREIEVLDQKIMAGISKINEHRRRRAFFLGFSQSPVDFINALLASQARDLRIAKVSMTGREYELHRRSHAFTGKWVEDAVMKYLHRKLASGH